MMLEKQIEAKAVKWAKSNSWLTYKFTYQTNVVYLTGYLLSQVV